MPPVRVTLATRIYPPEAGAAAFRLRQLSRALAARGATVRVVTSVPPRGSAFPVGDPPGVRVERRRVLRDSEGAVRGYLPYLSFDVPLLARLLRGPRPDLFVAEPPPTTGLAVAAAARLRGVPFGYFAADVLSDAAAAIGSPEVVVAAVRRMEERVLRAASAVVAVSEDVAAIVGRLGARPERVSVVGNGVDTELFSPEGPVVTRDVPYAVYPGTMSQIQGAGVFLDALAAVPPRCRHSFRLVFIGQGTQAPQLRARARRLGLDTVEFTGVLPPANTAAYLRGAAVALGCAVPGSGYEFAIPTKLYAALACGTPVLFVGPGAGAGLVRRHRVGHAVPYDPPVVAQALLDAIARPPSAARAADLAAWARRTVSLEAVGERAADALLAVARPRA